jgi:hypothetical protein
MALRGTLTHRKTRRLAKLLNLELWGALGLLEALYHLTAEQAPRGDVGRMSNADIAEELYWGNDPDCLINALIESGVLEVYEDKSIRLWIHDWHIHTDRTVREYLRNHKLTFANGAQPYGNATRKEEGTVLREKALDCVGLRSFVAPEPEPEPEPVPDKTLGGFCNKTPPSSSDETNDNPSTSRVKPSKYTTQELEEHWKTQLDAYPSRGKADRCVAKGKLAYFKLLRDGEEPQTILRGTQGYTAAMKTLGNADTAYVKQLPTFFHNRTWEEYLSGTSPTNGKPKPPHLTPLQIADGCSYVWSENTWKLHTPARDFEVMR